MPTPHFPTCDNCGAEVRLYVVYEDEYIIQEGVSVFAGQVESTCERVEYLACLNGHREPCEPIAVIGDYNSAEVR